MPLKEIQVFIQLTPHGAHVFERFSFALLSVTQFFVKVNSGTTVHLSKWWGGAHLGGKMLDLIWRCWLLGGARIFRWRCRAYHRKCGVGTKETGCVCYLEITRYFTLNSRAWQGRYYIEDRGLRNKAWQTSPFKCLLFLFNINPVLKVCDSESVTMAYPSPTFPQHGLRWRDYSWELYSGPTIGLNSD